MLLMWQEAAKFVRVSKNRIVFVIFFFAKITINNKLCSTSKEMGLNFKFAPLILSSSRDIR